MADQNDKGSDMKKVSDYLFFYVFFLYSCISYARVEQSIVLLLSLYKIKSLFPEMSVFLHTIDLLRNQIAKRASVILGKQNAGLSAYGGLHYAPSEKMIGMICQ